MARQFVLVRLIRIQGADLGLFDFDYDLTWAGFFLSADEEVYGRFGSRDAKSPDSHNTLAGLRHAMLAALEAHRQRSGPARERPQRPALRVEDYPAAKRLARGECIHCHQVYEFRRQALKLSGEWDREMVWGYPLPENVGLTLDPRQGNRVLAVAPDSPADRAGIAADDLLQHVNETPTASIADVQYGLHRAPAEGEAALAWLRQGASHAGRLKLAEGWRKTNLTWRPSLLDLFPSLTLYGEDLTAAEKKALGLAEKRLAFRQDESVAADLKAIGVQPGDVVLGVDGQEMEMTMLEFLAHVRRNYLVGERITLNLLRQGRRIDLPMTLK